MPKQTNWIVGSLVLASFGFVTWPMLQELLQPKPPQLLQPCISTKPPHNSLSIEPLLVGQTIPLYVGKLIDSECMLESLQDNWVWSSDTPEVVTIGADGKITGVAPGEFRISVKTPMGEAQTQGIVWPADTIVEIQPAKATVQVGDQITFEMVARTTQGQKLPLTTYTITTPDYQEIEPFPVKPKSQSNPTPLLDRNFHQMGATPGTFKALRPGTIAITGEIAGQARQAQLKILPR